MNTTKVRILCVDDDPLQRKLYQAILENESCEVDLATNGEEGLAKFKQNVEAGFNYYGLVITDRGMPQMNGSELVVRIKQLEEEKRRKQPAYLPTPIVMITGSTLEVDEKKKVLTSGAEAIYYKPVGLRELESLYRSYAKKKKPISF